MDLANLPPSLKSIIPYLKQSQQLEKHDLLMAYYCRVHAIQMAMEIKQKLGAAGSALSIPIVKILDQGDADKAKLGSRLEEEDEQKYVESFAMKAFSFADTQDRAGKASKATSTTFYSAFLFFNVLEHMGEVSEEVKLKKKYASWRSVDINNAIKNGVAPSPPPAIDQGEGSATESEDDIQLRQLEKDLNDAKASLQNDDNMSTINAHSGGNNNSNGMSSSLDFPSFPSIPSSNNNNNMSNSVNSKTSPSFPSFPSFPSPNNNSNNNSELNNKPAFPSFPSTNSNSNSNNNTPPSFPKFPTNSATNNQAPSFPSFPSVSPKQPMYDSEDEDDSTTFKQQQQQPRTTSPKFPANDFNNNSNNDQSFISKQQHTQQHTQRESSPPPYEFKQSPPQYHQQQQQQQHHNDNSEELKQLQQQIQQQQQIIQKQKQQLENQQKQNQMISQELEEQQQQVEQYQKQIQKQQQQIQQQQKQIMSGGGSVGSINFNYTPSDVEKGNAEKYAKWVISSLQFDDLPSAVKNAKLSYKFLTGVDL